MKPLSMNTIAKAVSGELQYGDGTQFVSNISRDSRTVTEKDLFFAIIGENFDAHDFIEDVIKNGCTNMVVSKDNILEGINILDEVKDKVNVIKVENTVEALGNLAAFYLKEMNIKTVGITGSTGKTSTKDMTASVLSAKYKVGRTKGNFNNEIGAPLTVLGLEEDVEVVVLEMGMDHKGEIDYLANMARPMAGVITNIGVSHMENLGSRKGIFDAKMEITNYFGKENTLIVCQGKEGDFLRKENLQGDYKLIIVGEEENCDLQIKKFENNGAEGISFVIKYNIVENSQENKTREYTCQIPVVGYHNALNGALAIAVGLTLGIDIEDAVKAMSNLTMTGGRLEIKQAGNIKIIDDTYNASPDSMKGAINVLKSIEGGRKIAILGDMLELGDDTKRFHEEIGKYAKEQGIDDLYSVGQLAYEISKGFGKPENNYQDKEALFEQLKETLQGDEVVLLKGSRFMQMETLIEKFISLEGK